MHTDAVLYVLIAITGAGAVGASLASDEAMKFISPMALFYAKMVNAVIFASASALKMFRSTTFAKFLETNGKNGKNGTDAPPSEISNLKSQI